MITKGVMQTMSVAELGNQIWRPTKEWHFHDDCYRAFLATVQRTNLDRRESA